MRTCTLVTSDREQRGRGEKAIVAIEETSNQMKTVRGQAFKQPTIPLLTRQKAHDTTKATHKHLHDAIIHGIVLRPERRAGGCPPHRT